MENRFSFRLADYLFRNAFPVYKVLYSGFKHRQDAEELAFLKKSIKPGDTVLDIGANIGFYAGIISKLVGPTGKVICFEPDRKNFSYLAKVAKSALNVQTVNAAVSDKAGKLTIYTSHRLNVDHRTYEPEEYDSSYEVNAITIDSVRELNKVNFIKIDIQGYELAAFKGMQETLRKNKGLSILTEFWPHGLKSAGTSADELIRFMSDLGYRAHLIKEGKLIEFSNNPAAVGTGENDYCNVVFKN